MNTLRKRLRGGGVVIGSWINTGSPIVAELMAQAGFDFLTVDAEHSAVALPQVQALFQAIRSGNPRCAPLVRVPGCDYSEIKRFMDAGAAGILCPLVNTAAQAREVVSAVKYPEVGGRKSEVGCRKSEVGCRRGVGFCRDNDYGMRVERRVSGANRETLVGVQIEHVAAVENIDDILAVQGIDVAFIGPYDLTASMGITAAFDHPDYLAAKRRILVACKRHGIAAGIHVVQPDVREAHRAVKQGYRFIAYSLDITMLTTECGKAIRALKGES